MELKDIVSISGMPGLYKIAGQRKNGLIVEALDGSGKKIPTDLSHKISVLADIAIFTTEGETKLAAVLLEALNKIKAGLALPDKKADEKTIRGFFAEVLPNYDADQVYVSDMKKFVSWTGILQDKIDLDALQKALNPTEEENKEVKEEKVSKSAKTKTDKPAAAKNVKADTKSKAKQVGQIRKMA